MDIKLLSKNNFEFKHSLGQNFITDTNLLKAIVSDAGVAGDDNVLEIGAGAGTLTSEICRATKGKVVSVEIDKSLKPILENNVKFENLTFQFKDILKVDPDDIKSWFQNKPFKVVANLPYYISSPIIFYLLENDFNLTSITVMLQLEVAQRLSAKKNTKDYGALTILLDLLGKVTLTRKVPKTLFTPQPKVDSAVVRIDIIKNKFDVPFLEVASLVKSSFAMRRKTLANNLLKAYNLSREQIENVLTKSNIDVKLRAENLDTKDYVVLFKNLKSEFPFCFE